ncbi:TlpA disulfide reductase family protein [Marinimicrobium agarilyticum]|uniref:TlpA disulfide reductase family protein n=1 Tax=Marinimicrobium agarilyticum TaxID=306546 RepID=UPI000480179F|nr:TlpA disulfide reductase family protein [Marinimicrobium agarilyticum]
MLKKFSFLIPLLLLSISSWAEPSVVPAKVFEEIKASASMKQGDILYIDFWASWCNPCRKSFPWMNEMVRKHHSKGFKVLAVNVDKERALADKFLASINTEFPVFYDPKGRLATIFDLKGMPSSFIVDYEGNLLMSHKGFFEDREATYEKEIKSLLTK